MRSDKLPKLILVFLSVDWPVFSRRPILMALAEKAVAFGATVVAVNRPLCPLSTIVRKPRRFKELISRPALESVAPNLWLYSPKYFIHDSVAHHVGMAAAANLACLRLSLAALQRRLGIQEPAPIVWYYSPRQGYVSRLYDRSFNVWELYDELASVNGVPDSVALACERRYRSGVHLFLATSPKLLETYGANYSEAELLENGLARSTWEELSRCNRPLLAALEKIPHPRLGFAGVISERLNWNLIDQLACRRPAWHFVFAGRVHQPLYLTKLRSRQNFHYLGELQLAELPSLLSGLDVAIMPYRDNRFFEASNPLKIYESAASGLHSVSSPIDLLRRYPASVVTVCKNKIEEWLSALDQSLTQTDAASRNFRQQFAGRYLWDDIAAKALARIAAQRSGGD